jgi:hypothetical protein
MINSMASPFTWFTYRWLLRTVLTSTHVNLPRKHGITSRISSWGVRAFKSQSLMRWTPWPIVSLRIMRIRGGHVSSLHCFLFDYEGSWSFPCKWQVCQEEVMQHPLSLWRDKTGLHSIQVQLPDHDLQLSAKWDHRHEHRQEERGWDYFSSPWCS